jgi:hypothetical protein
LKSLTSSIEEFVAAAEDNSVDVPGELGLIEGPVILISVLIRAMSHRRTYCDTA